MNNDSLEIDHKDILLIINTFLKILNFLLNP